MTPSNILRRRRNAPRYRIKQRGGNDAEVLRIEEYARVRKIATDLINAPAFTKETIELVEPMVLEIAGYAKLMIPYIVDAQAQERLTQLVKEIQAQLKEDISTVNPYPESERIAIGIMDLIDEAYFAPLRGSETMSAPASASASASTPAGPASAEKCTIM